MLGIRRTKPLFITTVTVFNVNLKKKTLFVLPKATKLNALFGTARVEVGKDKDQTEPM